MQDEDVPDEDSTPVAETEIVAIASSLDKAREIAVEYTGSLGVDYDELEKFDNWLSNGGVGPSAERTRLLVTRCLGCLCVFTRPETSCMTR